MRGEPAGDPFPITLDVRPEHVAGAVTTLAALFVGSLLTGWFPRWTAALWIPASFALGAYAAAVTARRARRIERCSHDAGSGESCPACTR